MFAEEEDIQLDVMIAKEEDMQLDDRPFDEREPEEEGEDQAILSDVNTDEESVDNEDWQAGCDSRLNIH